MSVPIRDQLLTTLSLSGAGYYPRQKLIDVACSHPGCEDREEVERELSELQRQGLIAINEGLVYAVPTEQDLSGYFAAADKYRKEMAKRNSWRYRVAVFFANIWHKIWLPVVFLICTSSLTVGLCAGEWRTAEVTAYCPCALCCGTEDRKTANNTSTDRVPYAFASDRSLPFGTRVFVPLGLGVLDRVRADNRWFSVDDRGGALDTEARKYGVLRLDLRVREHWWATRFGRRMLPIFIINN